MIFLYFSLTGGGGAKKPLYIRTLTLAYLSCEFALRAHFQCVVRTYDLKCVENANQLVSTQGKIHEYSYVVSTQGKIHEYSYVLGSVSALTNQNCLFRKIDIEVC